MPRTPSASGPVEVLPYDPCWVARFERYRDQISTVLGSVAVRIEHIGSTSIPGLAAKPVIDVQVSVANLEDLDAYKVGLESLGFDHRAHPEDPEPREFFRPPGPRVVHVHVVQCGSANERLYLLHRDYLRAHPESVRAYADLKQQLATKFRDARQSYQDAKQPFIDELTAAAEDWAVATAWQRPTVRTPSPAKRGRQPPRPPEAATVIPYDPRWAATFEAIRDQIAPSYHHLYVVAAGTKPHLDHVLLRDYLRRHPDRAAEYGKLKMRLAPLLAHDRGAYADAKSALVETMLDDARREERPRPHPGSANETL